MQPASNRPGPEPCDERRWPPDDLRATVEPFLAFCNGPIWAKNLRPGMSNFAVGNPTEMPMPAYVDALRSRARSGAERGSPRR